MAKVKIQGHASGTGILTVTAPDTDENRTITLPDATGTLLNSDGDGSSLTGISSVGGATGVDFNDDVKARFGTGNDLEIYHDGSNSYIDDTGTGNLLLKGQNVKILGSNDADILFGQQGGGVTLYYNGVSRVSTTTDGLDLGTRKIHASGALGSGYQPLSFDNEASDMYTPFYKPNCDRTSNSHSFSYLQGYKDNYSDLEVHMRGDGEMYCDASWNGGGADYAEYFEWEDGNPSDDDRRGLSVVLSGNKVKLAEEGDSPFGVVSATPVVVGDNDISRWKQKYLRDDFGREVMEDGAWIQWTDADGTKHSHESNAIPEGVTPPADAVTVTVDETGTNLKRRKLNPAWVEGQEYVARENRKEWVTIGLVGKLRIKKGQPVDSRWIKMRDVSDTVEEWLIR